MNCLTSDAAIIAFPAVVFRVVWIVLKIVAVIVWAFIQIAARIVGTRLSSRAYGNRARSLAVVMCQHDGSAQLLPKWQ